MSGIKEQAVRMISVLSDDNVVFLVEMMTKFMMPKGIERQDLQDKTMISHIEFMQELEAMRINSKPYFPLDLDAETIWREFVDERYSSFS